MRLTQGRSGLPIVISIAVLAGTLSAAAPGWAARSPYAAETTIDPKVMEIDEARYLGTALPRGFVLLDTEGQEFTLGDALGKPAILLLSYYGCDGACPTLNRKLARVLAQVSRFRIGRDYRVLTVSFDKHDSIETASDFVRKAGIPPALSAGWRHAVLKNRETDVVALADSVGFRFFWSRMDKTFLHPNVLVFLTPEGRVARYLYGTGLDAKAIELALIDADWNRIADSASVIDMLTGVCYSYNYAEGKYQPNYSLLVGIGSFVFGVSLMLLGAFMFRRKKMEKLSHAE